MKVPDDFPAIFYVTDSAGVVVQVSDLWLDTFQYLRQEVTGRPLTDFLSAASRSRARMKHHDGPVVWPLAERDQEFMTKTGMSVACTLATSPLKGRDGAVTGQIGWLSLPDTEKDLLQELRRKSARLQSCIEGTNAGTWEWNVQTGETKFNARWAEIVGYTLEELGPVSIHTWMELAHPDDLKNSEKALQDHWARKSEFYDVVARMRHKDGHWIWVHDRGRVFTWTNAGEPEWMYGTHFEIGAKIETEQQSARMQRLLERMGHIAGVGGWEVDLVKNEVLWTEQTRRIHGVPDTFIPTVADGISFYAPEARSTISAAVERGITEGLPWDLELPFIRYDGERIWVRAVGEVECDPNGKPSMLFGAFQDITKRVKTEDHLRVTRDWMQLASNSGRVGLWSVDVADGTLHWDPVMAQHFRVPSTHQPKTLPDWIAILSEPAAQKFKSLIKQLLSGQGNTSIEIEFIDSAKLPHVLKINGEVHRDSEGLIDRIIGACFDNTAERQMMQKLKEQSSQLSLTLSSIGDGVITTDRNRRITWINEVASRLTGWSRSEAIGKLSDEVFFVLNESTKKPVTDPVQQCLRQVKTVTLQPNSVLVTKAGELVAVDDSAAPIVEENGRVGGAILVFRDVSAQRALSRDIQYRASHDLLTGLLNRGEFQKRLSQRLVDPITRNMSYLFFFDLDHFKRVNDTYGHDAGDKLLRSIGQLLREAGGNDADIARHGGDEFILLKSLPNDEQARAFSEGICQSISKLSFEPNNRKRQFSIGASVGVVNLGLEPGVAEQQMQRVDIAAYAAKAQGRGQVCFWSGHDKPMQTAAKRIALIESIERANSEGLWVVHEQRIKPTSNADKAFELCELLIRMPNPDGTLTMPGDFLHAAERYGLMSEIDLWMLRYVMNRAKSGAEGVVFSINLSPTSVSSPSFQNDVLNIITNAQSALLSKICLEITESSLVQNYDIVSSFLGRLREFGLRIALDDFGAGATSFQYFKNLPADFLKIDGGFVKNYTDPVIKASLECFIRMAQITELKTIAEHVEEVQQIETMTGMGIDYLQGYAIDLPSAVA